MTTPFTNTTPGTVYRNPEYAEIGAAALDAMAAIAGPVWTPDYGLAWSAAFETVVAGMRSATAEEERQPTSDRGRPRRAFQARRMRRATTPSDNRRARRSADRHSGHELTITRRSPR
jgi:hypothetical protein